MKIVNLSLIILETLQIFYMMTSLVFLLTHLIRKASLEHRILIQMKPNSL